MFLFCLNARAYDTNEWNTYARNSDPTNSHRIHSPIMCWSFPILKVPFWLITVFSIRCLMFSFSVKPDKICVAIIHVQTQAATSMFPAGLSLFRFWRTNFHCFNCCFRFNGSLYDSCLWSLCWSYWNYSIWHHIRVFWCCLEIWWCCCICYNGWYIIISGFICCSDIIINWDF